MNYFEKSFNLTLLDLIVVATVGGLIVWIISKFLDYVAVQIKSKHEKNFTKMKKTILKFKKYWKIRKLFKLEYDKGLYQSIEWDSKFRYLYPAEKKYLKRHAEIHKVQKEKDDDSFRTALIKTYTS
ncbi:hypothetical protein [Paenisporosarcina sp. TG-14]|uniref:hypothetical protein n=1 Tax=Paenisporosarcina sp. TG-14 TaxID=1231057 RepID=UPI0002F32024|nr:hypothetical protein [Paenisporosarcina sp. TG-14]